MQRLKITTDQGNTYLIQTNIGLEEKINKLNDIIDDMYSRLDGTNRIQFISIEQGAPGYQVCFLTDVTTKRCFDWMLDKELSNYKNIRNDIEADWADTLKYLGDKSEFYEGIVDGHKVYFKAKYWQHEFTPEELETLANGGYVQFVAKNRHGEVKTYCGRIKQQEYKGSIFYGFTFDGWALQDSIWNHKFTDQEKERLLKGKAIYCTDFYSEAKKKDWAGFIAYEPETGIRLLFEDKPADKLLIDEARKDFEL